MRLFSFSISCFAGYFTAMHTSPLSPQSVSPSVPRPRRVFVSFARGFAILTIVVYHLLQQLALPNIILKMVLLGGAGIYVYLLMSGYGLSRREAINWPQFWRQRFLNTLLPYYVAVTLIFGLNILIPLYKTDGWREYLSHIFLYKMFINSYTRNLGEHFWFISTIIQFYILLPLLLRWQAQSTTRVFLGGSLLISIGFSVLISALGVDHLRIWYSFCLQYLWIYCLGMEAARRDWLDDWISRPWYVYAGYVIGCLAVVLAIDAWAGSAGSIFNDYFMFGAYGSLLVIVYLISLRWKMISQFVLWIEKFSYSLYLTHMLVARLYSYLTGYRPLLLVEVLLILGLAIGVALVFQRVIDALFRRRLVQQ